MKSNKSFAIFTEACFLEKCQVKIENNVTEQITEQDLYHFDITFWICFALMAMFGIPLTFGLVHYERFGGDPQKRSLTNRLTSILTICSTLAGFAIQILTAMLR